MAGSLNHIIDEDGKFRMELIENLRDARQALEECHQIIAYLVELSFGASAFRDAMNDLDFPQPDVLPIIQPDLHGAKSKFLKEDYQP